MRVARFLVEGVDVWLNNPRRPLEASGTSGMKAACNGVVNLSVLDGWWTRAGVGDNGWAIGGARRTRTRAPQDYADAQDLYRLLDRRSCRSTTGATRTTRRPAGRPRCAVPSPARSGRFSTMRMLHEYTERMYLPAAGVEVRRPASRRTHAEPG